MDEQQLSWLMIEPGWSVVSSDGSEIGYIETVVGDSDEDVFNGLSISLSFFDEPRYVPSERVGRIFENRVELDLSTEEAKRLDEFLEPPPSLDVGAEKASWSDRVLEGVTDVDSQPHDVSRWKRIRPWLANVFRR